VTFYVVEYLPLVLSYCNLSFLLTGNLFLFPRFFHVFGVCCADRLVVFY